jgi:BASS family bile acid:Na+ symporter
MSKSLSVFASATVSEQDVVTPFEQNLLVGLVFVIMFGLGAGLTVKDFTRALKRPKGVVIGWFAQYGVMPLLAFTLAAVFLFQLPIEYAAPVAVGALLMGSVPGGTTSNLFTYFSKGNLALSVIMTINTTLWALIMTPLALFFFGGFLFADNPEWQIPITNVVVTIAVMLVPVILGMAIRRYSANVGAVLELLGGFFGIFFILFLMATWVPRNFALLQATPWQVYVVAIGLGVFGMGAAFLVSRAFRVHPVDARSIAMEVGILNGPLAIAIILLTFAGNPDIGRILIVPAMYSLFIVIISTIVTFWFRRANLASEQKIPNLL